MTNQELPTQPSDEQPASGFWGASITTGFACAIVMWVIAWLLHMPGVHVVLSIAIPLLLAPLFIITFLWAQRVAPAHRLKSGATAGLIAGFINLMILGSNIVVQPDSTQQMADEANKFAPDALVVVFGSLVLSGVVGLIAGVLARKSNSTPFTASTWRSKFAWVTALTFLPLIVVGGAVTSTDAGLSVPDATTTYGAISILFPLKLMADPRIFLEHSHRLFGTLAGLTTLVLMIRVLIGESRKLPKVLTIALFLAVSLQGYWGIIRVAEQSTLFAVIHGIFAQLVFAGALSTAIILSDKWSNAQPAQETIDAAKKGRLFILAMLLALMIQLGLGAVTRHLNSSHAMMAHMGFAFIVLTLVILGGAMCIRTGKAHESGKAIRPYGAILHGLVVLQFTLGFAVLAIAWQGDEAPALPTADNLADAAPIQTTAALITTSHHLVGALVLATAAGAAVWIVRLAISPKTR